ncbi:MAG: LPXTG cell wall anchor domain-containing protein [Ruminococcus sp.]|nr:LPXTG cell wall anchor domain-containing protein [Ruminococcus sp.]
MKKSLRKTLAFICAITLTAAPLTLSSHSLPSFAEETVTVQSESGEVTQEQIEKNIIGSWIPSERDGQPILTNEKPVINIASVTEAYTSLSLVNDSRSPWHSNSQCEISVNGNCLTITANTETGSPIEHQLTITEISSDKFTANVKSTLSENEVAESVFTFVRVDDLSEAVLGTWEGKCTSEGSVFDDGKEHRWEYKPDGTYVYYNKVGDEWVPSDNTENEYFVSGNLLCTRWVDNGTENREWWEISVKDGKMSWTALRADEEGSNFTATFEMNKVSEVTQEQIEKNIIGSWVLSEIDGQAALTNEKIGYRIVSPTEAYSSISHLDGFGSPWQAPSPCDISINGNVVKITITNNSLGTIEEQYIITEISADRFTATRTFTSSFDGPAPDGERPAPDGERPAPDGEMPAPGGERPAPGPRENVMTFVKADDLSKAVLGNWEGKCTSEGSVFDDGKEHRWEYKADGTYVYYNKVGDGWVASDNTENEYFVSGNLLCMRWVDNGTENREWWEISVKDGKMSWTALRANEGASTYTATFEMVNVSQFISPERLCEMAEKDYHIKHPYVDVSAEIGTKNDDGTVDILLKDTNGKIVDTYKVDPKNGKGTNADGRIIDLPQTGMNTMGSAAAVSGALLMAAAGAWMVFRSTKKKKEEE